MTSCLAAPGISGQEYSQTGYPVSTIFQAMIDAGRSDVEWRKSGDAYVIDSITTNAAQNRREKMTYELRPAGAHSTERCGPESYAVVRIIDKESNELTGYDAYVIVYGLLSMLT